jgi:hypothetical protein
MTGIRPRAQNYEHSERSVLPATGAMSYARAATDHTIHQKDPPPPPTSPRQTTGLSTLEEWFCQMEAENARLRQLTATLLPNGTHQASTATRINVWLGDMRGVNDVMNRDAMTNDDMNVDL